MCLTIFQSGLKIIEEKPIGLCLPQFPFGTQVPFRVNEPFAWLAFRGWTREMCS